MRMNAIHAIILACAYDTWWHPATPADAHAGLNPANCDASCRIVWGWMREEGEGRAASKRAARVNWNAVMSI